MASADDPIAIADAVVTELNTASPPLSLISPTVQAKRIYPNKFPTIEDLSDEVTDVLVVPANWKWELANRGARKITTMIDVGVIKKLDTADNAEIDPFPKFIGEIGTLMLGKAIADPKVSCLELHDGKPWPIYSPQHLAQHGRSFLGVITLHFVGFVKAP